MNTDIHKILKSVWGYNSFRPKQEEIIRDILEGADTLALLPTGGGKSICFQVPALASEGICLVVSPLIALMKDQVENLNKRGIKAYRITSDLSKREIDIALDNCIYGDIKFLYVSPERLKSELFIERFKKMNVNLIAVDEAHCISQWGYDFRPSYLDIAELREIKKDVPMMALTASATTEVVTDIQEKLQFKKQNVKQLSFERKNISYVVLEHENKRGKLLDICKKVAGTGIIYAGTRRKTWEISNFLNANGIQSSYYHAGLKPEQKNQIQDSWKNNQTRVIVATNAFGMGIDKPDVRFVVHMDIPANLESYYQEAGRAGRDGRKSYAVLLWNKMDVISLQEKTKQKFPELEEIQRVYKSLSNYLKIAIGAGLDTSYSFNIQDFLSVYKLSALTSYNALNILERAGYIVMNEAVQNPARLMFLSDKKQLYNFQIEHRSLEPLIKVLLRSYGGLFDNLEKIDEKLIASRLKINTEKLEKQLKTLSKHGVIEYSPKSNLPKVTYLTGRQFDENIKLDPSIYSILKEATQKRMTAMLNYTREYRCRNTQLLRYFGENEAQTCGTCDVCLERKKLNVDDREFEKIELEIKKCLTKEKMNSDDLSAALPKRNKKILWKVLRWLIDVEEVRMDENKELILSSNCIDT